MSITDKVVAGPDRLPDTNEAVGQSASAIAHDIDVAIAPITLYTNALLEHEPLSERARHYLASIQRAVDDVSQNVGRLRELDRPRDDLPETASRTQRPTVSARSLRVLLIDDDPSLIEALRTSLIDEGHKVTAANGGQSGIDTFRGGAQQRPALRHRHHRSFHAGRRRAPGGGKPASHLSRHAHHPADGLAASAEGRGRAFAERRPVVREAAAHSRVAHGACRAHRAPHFRPAGLGGNRKADDAGDDERRTDDAPGTRILAQ